MGTEVTRIIASPLRAPPLCVAAAAVVEVVVVVVATPGRILDHTLGVTVERLILSGMEVSDSLSLITALSLISAQIEK